MRVLQWMRVGCVLLAAGLTGGVCRAATWFPLGPFGGDARSLAADPADPKHLFLGTANGWLYDTHDGGITWARVAQIDHRNDLVVDHIVVDRKNPQRLLVAAYAADHPDGGLFVSEDYGKTWYSQAEMRGQSIRSLARSVSDPNELIAGALNGVFRSTDNGVHWKQISPEGSGEIKEVQSIAIDPADPNVIYAGTWHLPWKTTDGGATWHNIKEGIIDDSDVFSIIVDPKQPNIVYASACSGIYKSLDAGGQFKGGVSVNKGQGIPSSARRTRKLALDPVQSNTVYAGTTEGLYKSTDAGSTWVRMTGPDVIVNDVYVDPSNPNHVLMASDRGGVYRSEDGGTTFESSNSGFSARQVIAFASDAQSSSTLYVGVVNDKQTGGVFQSTDGAVHWVQQSQGLGGRDVFSLVSLPDGTLLAGTAHGIFRLNDGTWADSSILQPPAPASEVKPETVTASVEPADEPAVAKPVHGVAVPVATSHAVAAGHGKPAKHGTGAPVSTTHAAKKSASGPASTKPVAVQRGGHFVRVKATVVSTSKGRSAKTATKGHAAQTQSRAKKSLAPHKDAAAANSKPAPKPARLDAVVYALARSGDELFAGSGTGLLSSTDGGQRWTPVASLSIPEVHYVAVLPPAKDAAGAQAAPIILAAGLQRLAMSPDGGATWDVVPLPADLTQIGAVGIDGEKNLWIGGREGVWLSTDFGANWKTLRNLFLRQVDSIFYDAAGQRVLVTSFTSPLVFSVQIPDHKVTYWDTGWMLRFVRPVGNHLVGATLFDGMVVQPEMVASPAVSVTDALK